MLFGSKRILWPDLKTILKFAVKGYASRFRVSNYVLKQNEINIQCSLKVHCCKTGKDHFVFPAYEILHTVYRPTGNNCIVVDVRPQVAGSYALSRSYQANNPIHTYCRKHFDGYSFMLWYP